MAESVPETLESVRAEIDLIDLEILRLLNQRAQAAGRIGRLKTGPIYRPEREAQVLERVRQNNPGPLSGPSVAFLFREIMSACLAFERPIRVACLGPLGTYSEAASVRHFGHAIELMPGSDWEDVFRSAESGRTDFAVVPVENSTEGSVGLTLDRMVDSSLRACGEVLLPIHHQLLGVDGTDLSTITAVYAHAQSLGQCARWLTEHLPQAERIAVGSNAQAAQRIAENPTLPGVAIAGQRAAERFRLAILESNIEDGADNTTRFLVLGNLDPAPSGRDKTSLVLGAKNQPGAIHALLTPLADHGVSLTRLESRPARTSLWSYVFFVDIEGHRTDPNVRAALERIEQVALFCKILGSYPAACL